MPPKVNPDLIRLKHMLDAIQEALAFICGKTRASLNRDRKLALARVKELEILGESASSVSERYQIGHSEIPWTSLIATRNRLIHGYFDIDLDIIWTTISRDLPPLRKILKTLI